MNEKKKALLILIGLFVILIIFLTTIISSFIKSNRKLQEIKDILNSKEPQIVYISRPTCYYCNLLEPITSHLREKYNLNYYSINSDDFSSLELKKVLKILDIDYNSFGTPYILVVQNGKVLGEQIGYANEDVLFKLFQKYNLIDSSASLYINYIDDINTLLDVSEKNIVLIGESGDLASTTARFIVQSIAEENGLDINYFDTSSISDNNEYSNLLNNLGIKKLPTLLVLQEGKVIAQTSLTEKDDYIRFFRDNGYIK